MRPQAGLRGCLLLFGLLKPSTLEETMSEEHVRPGEIIPLPAGKGLHVFHGGDLSGVGLERAVRKALWTMALRRCIRMLTTSQRAQAWATEMGASMAPGDHNKVVPFPSVWEGFETASALRDLAVVAFMTVFNPGNRDPGAVADNKSMRDFLDECLAIAFPDGPARDSFEALRTRLRTLRDKLIAHVDGEAQEADLQAQVASFSGHAANLDSSEVPQFLEGARALLAAIEAQQP